MNSINLLLMLFVFGFSLIAKDYERPPQYVMLAFDGSKSLSMWQETRDFARLYNVKWSYFISGTYFATDAKSCSYKAPRHGASSAIGWGESKSIILKRLNEVEEAEQEGHLISSHAVGHWNGDDWSEEEWDSENSQFTNILLNSFDRIGALEPPDWQNLVSYRINGFRAPQLGSGIVAFNNSNRLYRSLKKHGHKFDTSLVNSMNYWPQKKNGIWDFPLAMINVPGRSKRIVSMDYNMKMNDISGERVLTGYLDYFKNNYEGNRAPIHIGHHFSKWRNGEYWWALQEFVKSVCHKPEVICGNYMELVNFMDNLEEEQLAKYQRGEFKNSESLNLSFLAMNVYKSRHQVYKKNNRPPSKDELLEAYIDGEHCADNVPLN